MATTELANKIENPVIEETNLPEYTPDVDIHTDNENVYLQADLPGVRQEDLDISLKNRVLTITGKQGFEQPEVGAVYHEFRKGVFKRSFNLSPELNSDGIEADLQNGVLSLRIPKAQPEVKKITINR